MKKHKNFFRNHITSASEREKIAEQAKDARTKKSAG